MSSFASLPLLDSLKASLHEQELKTLTEVQARTIPKLLAGESLVGVAETGSGKTLSFVLPMLHQLKSLELAEDPVTKASHPRGLVLVPARELGEQVSKVFKGLTHKTRLRVRTALGGTKKQVARQNVKGGFEVLVATPGRLGQLLESKEVRLSDVRILVFDEADQMLDPGFLPVATQIISACPKDLQLVMFSATLPKALQKAVEALFPKPPIRVETKGSQRLVPTLQTVNKDVIRGDRWTVLGDVLDADEETPTILFANTRQQCDKIGTWLNEQGYAFADYRGQMEHKERRDNLARFRSGQVQLLLTTDLGGRGLDIEQVGRVINVHLPQQLDNYLHRAGRTARAGRKGLVVNLVTERDAPILEKVATIQG
jgi:superfamily II DNA/RNA helicase